MPREGCKLLVRNSKGGGQEEYYVDSIEVVSFGRSFFFRSQERPKSFLVPVSDYEILEQKEVRMSLKNVAPERSIKIGGGREGHVRPPRETAPEESYEPQDREPGDRPPMDRGGGDRKRDKRRRGRRGGGRPDGGPMHETRDSRQAPMEEPFPMEEASYPTPMEGAPSLEARSDEQKAPSFISKLFPPPPTLIKDSLSRYKTAEVEEEPISQKEEKLDDILLEPPLSDKEDDEPPFEE